ncbi:MAG: TonB C-terminal domain-containing protein [Acidobacteriales bacterium]|nr:TonB C-terminal domain-containing protein [Terriglobales bacterium]
MSVTKIPPSDPQAPSQALEQRDLFEAQHWETAYRGFNPDHVPHLLIQLQDDLSRSRKREALWLSVVLHLLIVVLLINTEKLMGFLPRRALVLPAVMDLEKQKEATYLELPPDEQKLTRRPDSKIISDKDRIATSKAPQIDREYLRKLLESSRPGRPGPTGPAQGSPPPEMAQNQGAQRQQPPPQENQQPSQNSGFSRPDENSQIAALRAPAAGGGRPRPSFSTPTTAGSAIEQATRAAAANRGNYGGGEAGDYGLSQGRGGAKALDQAEILTDTMGVDFGPYLQRITQVVRSNWMTALPPSVFPPILKQGKLSIQFVILKDGKVAGMELHTTSGDVALDRAAWASITASNPFPPLPKEFPGQVLGLRFYYFYNLDKIDMQ